MKCYQFVNLFTAPLSCSLIIYYGTGAVGGNLVSPDRFFLRGSLKFYKKLGISRL
jgi:hypothetical protein